MSVEIFVARHGQSEDNVNRILGGRRDKPLTDLGRVQAKNLAQGIIDTGLTFDAIYCSPLIRAHETADIVAEMIGLPAPKVMQDLIEADFGVMDGKLIDDIEKLCEPKNIMKVGDIVYFFNVEGEETYPQLIERAKHVINDVNALHPEGKVLLVSHGDFGKMIYAAATGRGWRDVLNSFHFGNAELIDISKQHKPHVIELEQFNS